MKTLPHLFLATALALGSCFSGATVASGRGFSQPGKVPATALDSVVSVGADGVREVRYFHAPVKDFALTVSGLVNMNARLYDPLAARFLSPDPFVQAPDFTQNFNRFAYALNNPLKYTDESGEFVFSLFLGPTGAFLDAACWGALLGGASYAINESMGERASSNSDWSEFGKAVAWGAISGAASFGVGEFCSAIGGHISSLGAELVRSATHGMTQGVISSLQGNNFWGGFTSGMLSSFGSSGYSVLDIEDQLGTIGMLASSSLIGDISSVISGDSFTQGFCIGLTTSGLNHLQHKTEEYKFFYRLKKHYEVGSGKDFILNAKEFNYLLRKGTIDTKNAALGDDNFYIASIDFYRSSADLKYSFGKATVKFSLNGDKPSFVGFYDRYDFDSKQWGGVRSYSAEIITRLYGALSNGVGFNIYYGKSCFK